MTTKLGFIGGFAVLALACSSPETGSQPGPPLAPPGGGVAPGGGNNNNNQQQPTGQDTVDPNQNQNNGAGGSASTENNGNVQGVSGGAMVDNGAAGAGMDVGGEIPVGDGFVLTPVAGWVAGGTNGLGIQGSFFPLSDAGAGGDTTITPATDFTMSDDICVSGTASQVLNGADGMPAYGTYWGGGVGFNLADPGMGNGEPGAWDRTGFSGFQFTLTGSTIPPLSSLRFQVDFPGKDPNTPYCAQVSATNGTPVTVSFDQIGTECWNGVTTAPLPAGVGIINIQWQVSTNATAPTPFDFCIENLTVVQ